MFIVLSFLAALIPSPAHASATIVPPPVSVATSSVADVPFYSQFKDVSSASWQKRACGIASLAMVVDYYHNDAVSVDGLLKEGIAVGAYSSAGWTYKGLIAVAAKHGLAGESYDLGAMSSTSAFAQFKKYLAQGPVIASVHYKFDPKSTIPHLVVIDGIEGGYVHYNDPAAKEGDGKITVAQFVRAWKQRFIVIRPPESQLAAAQ